MTAEIFELEVERVLENLPPALAERIRNVAFGVEDGIERPNLLGLYEGIPLTRRGDHYTGALPDRITIYRWPILNRSWTREDVVQHIEVTVKHEIGHYFGLSEDRLHELGWG